MWKWHICEQFWKRISIFTFFYIFIFVLFLNYNVYLFISSIHFSLNHYITVFIRFHKINISLNLIFAMPLIRLRIWNFLAPFMNSRYHIFPIKSDINFWIIRWTDFELIWTSEFLQIWILDGWSLSTNGLCMLLLTFIGDEIFWITTYSSFECTIVYTLFSTFW